MQEVNFNKIKDGTTEIKYSVIGAWRATLIEKDGDFKAAKDAFLKTYGYEVIKG